MNNRESEGSYQADNLHGAVRGETQIDNRGKQRRLPRERLALEDSDEQPGKVGTAIRGGVALEQWQEGRRRLGVRARAN